MPVLSLCFQGGSLRSPIGRRPFESAALDGDQDAHLSGKCFLRSAPHARIERYRKNGLVKPIVDETNAGTLRWDTQCWVFNALHGRGVVVSLLFY